ncbi:MAG: hypothetical protein ABSB35_28710 [Bryobacteraceae bacterium]
MRAIGWILFAGAAMAQAPSFQPVGSMSQLMINIIYPTSDAIFYVDRAAPKTEVEWIALQNQALMLAESGNLLMMPGRARDQDKWIKESKMLVDAGTAAFKAARAKDLDGVRAVNDALNTACVQCHQDYRTNYRKRN